MNDIDFRNTLVKALALDKVPFPEKGQGFIYTFTEQHVY